MLEKKWSIDLMPDQSGRIAIVTGGNIGLGFKSTLELARKGAYVIIACRSRVKGNDAVVIDFKFGRVVRTEDKKQVREYMTMITDIGFKHVEGYLWYVELEKVLQVA